MGLVDIKVAMESRRGGADVGKCSSSWKTSTIALSGRSGSSPTLFEYLSKCMSGITTVILFAG
jgi:hypothetical protein